MFRRWRRARLAAQAASHVAPPAPRPTAADLRGEQLFELVNAKLMEFIGPNGAWTVVRRSQDDTDSIFHAVLAHQISVELTRAVLDERDAVAVVVDADQKPMALDWEPAPLVVWADPLLDADAQAPAVASVEVDAYEFTARAA
ncbi:hypothetical protein ACDF64_16630 [Agromyces sp. MMS24-JH15]|uniref:hypothetical protein n=1 Tax=Agromyces sp. MMS24-JH15 TaxID=3243765 RepID=UPI0037495B69